jgi:hypothetical protein
MKKLVVFTLLLGLLSFKTDVGVQKIKCMIQMTNYTGEGAYIVISLINPSGAYEQTLYVQGDDKEWYYELEEWWKFQGRKRAKLDGRTGATISGGQRAMNVLSIDKSKLNAGYKIRFESAVEANNYFIKDVEIDLTSSNLAKKFNGKGFIRYVRFMAQ